MFRDIIMDKPDLLTTKIFHGSPLLIKGKRTCWPIPAERNVDGETLTGREVYNVVDMSAISYQHVSQKLLHGAWLSAIHPHLW